MIMQKTNPHNIEILAQTFIHKFNEIEKKVFIKNEENIQKLKALLYYFTKNESFYSSTLLNKSCSKPSFEKGLLIIGGYGTGKTSYFKALEAAFKELRFTYLTIKNTQELVLEYECLSQSAKAAFFDSVNKGKWVFDDLLNEGEANNYGKKNLLKHILELRCHHKKLTFATCNYDPNYPNDLENGLMQFHNRYGGRVYDRLFEMFNIIEFKGKSMRR